METQERWEAATNGGDQFLKFNLVENKRSQRPDLHAFLLLDELFPFPGRDMVASASHDEIWLDVSGDDIESLTDEQIIELNRCGVRYCEEHDSLCMFV